MKSLWAVMIAVVVASCSDQVTSPLSPRHTEILPEMQFLEFSPTAFEKTQKVASFWAVRGEHRSLILRYADTEKKYLRFEVDSTSLANWPDGTPFLPGDSVQITVEADSLRRWVFHFSPAGLKFNLVAPAVLTLEFDRVYDEAGLLQSVNIWKRDQPTASWELLPATRLSPTIARTDVYDFTDFGLAIN